jgi:glycosyltransferase involved in cell wall biosynthesis
LLSSYVAIVNLDRPKKHFRLHLEECMLTCLMTKKAVEIENFADKVDLVIWTYNGAETLPLVLRAINEVIPPEYVKKRIVSDDRSTDETRRIAESLGWMVVLNDGKGISDNANTALRYVESEFFISFEQDVVLAANWWERIPSLLLNPDVAVASGVRLPDKPLVVRKIQEFSNELYEQSRSREDFYLVKTLDNTVYKTKVIRSVGGFPKLSISAGVDTVLAKRINEAGFRWVVDFRVVSTHLRKGLKDELNHYFWYGSCRVILDPYLSGRNLNLRSLLFRFLLSPVRGLQIAIQKKSPEAIYVHPLMRLAFVRGVVKGFKNSCS